MGLKIDNEDSVASAEALEASQDIRMNVNVSLSVQLIDCPVEGSVDLGIFPTGGNGFQEGLTAKKDSGDSWGGVQAGDFTCGKVMLPSGTFWQFFSPDDDFEVNP